jgi:Domain of unknown function (DUF4194)
MDEQLVSVSNPPLSSPDLSVLAITLLKKVIYREGNERLWSALLNLQTRVREHFAVLGLELALDESEGYAFLRSRPELPDADTGTSLPRLITRRQLSFPVSLLLALLRKRLAEFDTGGGDTRLVLTRKAIVELMRLFMPDNSNEVKLIDQIETHINKVVDLGFLRRLPGSSGVPEYEVQRILKAFVDAQWLASLDAQLERYRIQLAGGTPVSGSVDDE